MGRLSDNDSLLRALTELGKRASNKSLRDRLGWAEDKYWRIHARMFAEGLIEKGRGPGGTVILIESPLVTGPTATTPELAPANQDSAQPAPRELDLYEPAKKALDAHWAPARQLDQCHCEITALQGRRETGGSWTRPDLLLIGFRKYEYLPDRVLEIVSFEVKPCWDVSIKGVMEALAHRQTATRSFVVYHTDGRDFTSFQESARIEDLAVKHGVGVYIAKDISDWDQWSERVPARRAQPDPEEMDNFIKRTLSESGKSKLRRWF